MFQQDYILRIIEQAGVAMRRLVRALREQRPEDAVDIATEALDDVSGVPSSLIDRLSGAGLVTMLSASGAPDPTRMLLIAELLYARAEAYRDSGHDEASARDLERTVALLETGLLYAEDEILVARMRALLGWAREGELGRALPETDAG